MNYHEKPNSNGKSCKDENCVTVSATYGEKTLTGFRTLLELNYDGNTVQRHCEQSEESVAIPLLWRGRGGSAGLPRRSYLTARNDGRALIYNLSNLKNTFTTFSTCLTKIVVQTVFFLAFSAMAQPKLKDIPPLSCMPTTGSTITYPGGDTTAYYAFFKKLDKLIFEGKGNVTILHIGGSHIQAGTLSHQHRTNLLESFPGIISNRGLLFPFSAAKTNNPYNYRTTYTGEWEVSKNTNPAPPFALGLSGITIATKDTLASIEIQMRNTENLFFDFRTVYVLGHCDSGWVSPLIQLNDSVYLLGIFDSARLAYRFDLENYVDAFRLSFAKNDSLWEPFYLRGFWVENQLSGLTYADVGVNGASVPSYLKCSYLENDLSFVKPDLCIFSIGINDASGSNFDTVQFQRNYKELIQRIKSVAPDCAILFTTNNDSYIKSRRTYHNNANGLLAQKAFYSLAKHYKTGVWDLFSFMGGLTSMKKWEHDSMAQKDKVHFTPQGYKLLGDLLYNAFWGEYLKYLGLNF